MSTIRERISSAAMRASKPTKVQVPALGTVYVKRLSVAEVEARRDETENATPIASLLARAIVDEEGNAVFDPANPDDIGLLRDLEFAEVSPLISAINSSQGIGAEGEAAALKN